METYIMLDTHTIDNIKFIFDAQKDKINIYDKKDKALLNKIAMEQYTENLIASFCYNNQNKKTICFAHYDTNQAYGDILRFQDKNGHFHMLFLSEEVAKYNTPKLQQLLIQQATKHYYRPIQVQRLSWRNDRNNSKKSIHGLIVRVN